MSSKGSPVDVGPGYVVRIRCGGGGLTYWGCERMTKTDAEAGVDQFVGVLSQLAAPRYVPFTSSQGRVQIRVERITAVEAVRTGAVEYVPAGGKPTGMETR